MKNYRQPVLTGAARKTLLVAAVLGIIGSATLVAAQEDAAPAPVTAVTADAGAVASETPAAGTTTETPTEPEVGSNEDLLNKLKEAKQAYDELRDEQGQVSKKYLIAALIAALANLLLSVIKRVMKLTGKAKRVLPWAAMGLGLIVGVLSHYAGGTSWMDAILYGGAAPGAIIIQELLRPIKSKDSAKADA
jgi:hypothetical protein